MMAERRVSRPLDRLREGIRKFGLEVYPEAAERYQKAANEPQQPHTLIIACADSRMDPELITQSGPGELFVMRNIGNLVPAFGEMLGGVSAVIEYAVAALRVKHVVVCGHSDCGAMKAMLAPESVPAMPTVESWLTNAAPAFRRTMETRTADESRLEVLKRLTEQNVLLQMVHLRTHPSVAKAVEEGELTLSGWVYDIATGRVRISEDGEKKFHHVPVASLQEGETGVSQDREHSRM